MFRFYDFKKILSLICTATGGKVNLLPVIQPSYLSRRSPLRTLKVKRLKSTNPTAAV